MLKSLSFPPYARSLQSIVVKPLTIAPDRALIEAISLMNNEVPTHSNSEDRLAWLKFQARSGCVAIVENDLPIGIITARDVMRLYATGQDVTALEIRQVMIANSSVIDATLLTDLSMALDLLDRPQIAHLLIIDERSQSIYLVTRELLQAGMAADTPISEPDLSIDRQVKQELVLREIGQKVRRSMDLPIVFETALREIRAVLATDRVGIFKFSDSVGFDRGQFVAESVAAGVESILDLKIDDPNFGAKLARYYQKGGINIVEDIHSAGLLDNEVEILSKFQVRANLVVPLLDGDRLYGLLCLHQCSIARDWQESEISFVKQIAQQIGIGIQQASLVDRLQSELIERERAEVRLRQSNEELARATQLKDEFLANMSHELRTPLNAVLGLAEGLSAANFGAINERQQRALATIEKSGRHLLALINDILDLSKIEANQLKLELTDVPIPALCKNSILFVKELAHKKQIPISLYIPESLQYVTLQVDNLRFRQILINLLSNAIKFTPTGGQVTLSVEVLEKQIAFSVRDTGIGIAAENLSKLFQSFVQIDSSLNRQYAGTGLGLALVKRLAELHGGSVSVSSELDRGSCFTVCLPYDRTIGTIAGSTNSPISGDLRAPEALPAIREKALVLIADDNEANLETMTGYLQTRGYRLLEATNGREALDLALAHRPDIILMDIQMPDMDGLEAIAHIRQLPKIAKTIVIAVTALAMPTDRQKCLDAGADVYTTKPVKLGQLVATIEKLLHGD